jgi:perosamine synthetase
MTNSADHFLGDQLLAVLSEVAGSSAKGVVALHEPEFRGSEQEYVRQCIDSGWVSSVGSFVDEFEQRLAEYTGAAHAIAVVNGTAAQHVALMVAGVGSSDEVIVPALSFVATANAVAHCGATPHFVDADPVTLGIDVDALAEHLAAVGERTATGLRNARTGRRIAAIVPMHTFGHPVDLEPLLELAASHRVCVVEDAAESLGSFYRGRHTGTFGQIGALSFNGNKIITTGGGGALLTNDPALARHAKHLTTTAKVPHRWAFVHDEVGYNYRLPNLNAALGCAQMERLPDFLERKRSVAHRYRDAMDEVAGLRFLSEPPGCVSNYWLNAVCLARPDMSVRDALLARTNDAGYQCRPVWTLLHKLPMYEACPRSDLGTAEAFEAGIICLPSSARLGNARA